MTRILHVITSLEIGGAEKLMVDLIPRLKSPEIEVDLLVFNPTRTIFTEQLEEQGIKVMTLSNSANVYNPLNILRLLPIIREYDIIHTHNTACQLFVPIAKVLSFAKCKLVTTEHNTTNRRRNKKYLKLLDQWMYSKYLAVIGVSEKATDNLKKYLGNKINSINITTIANGIDFVLFNNAKSKDLHSELGLSSDSKLITMVSRFDKQKDQQTLIKSAKYLPDNNHILLVGEGNYEQKQYCIELVQSLSLFNRIHFLGIRHDIPQILKGSNLIVLSSHYEGLSLSSIEAMASGRPFVASDVPGLREVVSGAGILFPDGNSQKLAEILNKLLSDKVYYISVVNSCVNKAKEFDISETVKKYLKSYCEL